MVRGLSDYIRIEEIHFTQLRRRILQLKQHIRAHKRRGKDEEEPITLVVDASGLTVSKKGDYIEEKWIRKIVTLRCVFSFVHNDIPTVTYM